MGGTVKVMNSYISKGGTHRQLGDAVPWKDVLNERNERRVISV